MNKFETVSILSLEAVTGGNCGACGADVAAAMAGETHKTRNIPKGWTIFDLFKRKK